MRLQFRSRQAEEQLTSPTNDSSRAVRTSPRSSASTTSPSTASPRPSPPRATTAPTARRRQIKTDLARHLAGDYTPSPPKVEQEEGLFSGWGNGGRRRGDEGQAPHGQQRLTHEPRASSRATRPVWEHRLSAAAPVVRDPAEVRPRHPARGCPAHHAAPPRIAAPRHRLLAATVRRGTGRHRRRTVPRRHIAPVTDLGLAGAIIINLCGGAVLATMLVLDVGPHSARGRASVWLVVCTLFILSVVEIATL